MADYPERKPFCRLNLNFKKDSRGPYQAQDVKSTTLSAWRQGASKQFTLEGDFRKLGKVTMAVKGEHRSAFDKKQLFSWNVSARCSGYRQKSVADLRDR